MGKRWKQLFPTTFEIYGLGILAIFAILLGPLRALKGINIILLVDNYNAVESLVGNAPGPPVIAAKSQLIWYRIAALNAAVWFGRVPPAKNIAELPKKLKISPVPSRRTANYHCLQKSYELISAATMAIATGQTTQPLPRPTKKPGLWELTSVGYGGSFVG